MEGIIKKVKDYLKGEDFQKFLTKIKENFKTIPKENDEKKINLEVKGGNSQPNGIAFELYSIGADKYAELVPEEKDYMKEALTMFTIQLMAKDDASKELMKGAFETFKPMVLEMPFVADHKDKVDVILRENGLKMCIDVVSKDHTVSAFIKELGMKFSEFYDFHGSIKTDFAPKDFFDLTLPQIAEKACTLYLGLQGKGVNPKYLINSFLGAVEGLEPTEEKHKKKLRRIIYWCKVFLSFIELNCVFQYCPKTLAENVVMRQLEKHGFAQSIEEFKGMVQTMGPAMVKPMIEGFGALEVAKAVNIDDIKIAVLSPFEKSGVVQSIQLPGITSIINEMILA